MTESIRTHKKAFNFIGLNIVLKSRASAEMLRSPAKNIERNNLPITHPTKGLLFNSIPNNLYIANNYFISIIFSVFEKLLAFSL